MQWPRRLWFILAGLWLVLSAAASWILVGLAVAVVTIATPAMCAVGGAKAAQGCADAIAAQRSAIMWDAFLHAPVYVVIVPAVLLLLTGSLIATRKARAAIQAG